MVIFHQIHSTFKDSREAFTKNYSTISGYCATEAMNEDESIGLKNPMYGDTTHINNHFLNVVILCPATTIHMVVLKVVNGHLFHVPGCGIWNSMLAAIQLMHFGT
ncbi:hypothetical protein M8J77_012439 [Diaphorina citri]|nr:hypothetical protein M8J77_012439 [Diaphorina citri]